MIKQVERSGELHGYSLCRRGPKLTYLLFIEDSFLFYRATMDECGKVLEILDMYEGTLGKKVNRSCKVVIYNYFVLTLILCQFDCNYVQSFVPCILCEILL